jgi:hypothetical protein
MRIMSIIFLINSHRDSPGSPASRGFPGRPRSIIAVTQGNFLLYDNQPAGQVHSGTDFQPGLNHYVEPPPPAVPGSRLAQAGFCRFEFCRRLTEPGVLQICSMPASWLSSITVGLPPTRTPFRYADHSFNYLEFLRSFGYGKLYFYHNIWAITLCQAQKVASGLLCLSNSLSKSG